MRWIIFLFLIVQCKYNCVVSQERVPPGISPQHYQQPPVPTHQGSNMHQMPHQQVPQYQMPQHQMPQHQMPQHQMPQQQMPQQQMPQQQMPQQQMHQQQMPQHQMPQHVPSQQYQQPPQVQNVPISDIPIHHTVNQQVHEEHNHGHHHGQAPVLHTSNIAEEKSHIAEHLDVPMDTSKMSEQELQFHYFKMHDADNNNKLDGCELIKSLIHWHEEGNKDGSDKGEKVFKDEELSTLIDPILEMDDTNKDGFIDYPEFIRAQQKAESATSQ